MISTYVYFDLRKKFMKFNAQFGYCVHDDEGKTQHAHVNFKLIQGLKRLGNSVGLSKKLT